MGEGARDELGWVGDAESVSAAPILVDSLGLSRTGLTARGGARTLRAVHALEAVFEARAPKWLRSARAQRLFGIPQTVEVLRALPREGVRFEDVVAALRVRHRIAIDAAGLDHVPTSGPVVVAANHPYPILDYYALAYTVEQRRAPVRVVVDDLSRPMTELHPLLAFVGSDDEERGAFWATQSAFLREGGTIVIFPAGQTNYRDGRGVAVETPWRGGALKLASLAGAKIVPAFVSASTSRGYNALRRVLPRSVVQNLNLREAHARSAQVAVKFGAPLDPAQLTPDALRDAVYATGGVEFTVRRRGRPASAPRRPSSRT